MNLTRTTRPSWNCLRVKAGSSTMELKCKSPLPFLGFLTDVPIVRYESDGEGYGSSGALLRDFLDGL